MSLLVVGAYSAMSVVIIGVPLVGSFSSMERPICGLDARNTPI